MLICRPLYRHQLLTARLSALLLRHLMRDYTLKEKAKITAGAIAALVIVGWLAVFALALMSAG